MPAIQKNGTGRVFVSKSAIPGRVGREPCHQAATKFPGLFHTGGTVHFGHAPDSKKGGKKK